MKSPDYTEIIRSNLQQIVEEISTQSTSLDYFPNNILSFEEQVGQLREYIEQAGEYGIAYESLVALLSDVPFVLSGKAAVGLLEVGLLMKFKTERDEDRLFDSRCDNSK